MTKTHKAVLADENKACSFPVPFTLDKFRKDIVEVFFFYVRTIAWITDAETAWKIAGKDPGKDLLSIYDPVLTAADLDVTYEQIQATPFARALEHLYNFAYFGRCDASAEKMLYESYYMWIADLVSDAAFGYVSVERDSYGSPIQDSANRCVQVAETANARNVLEGGEAFSYFSIGKDRDDYVSIGDGVLTVRQMALLAGMEEMSIRSAAGPKRVNRLITHNDEGKTRIRIDVAKEWLMSKGKYIPITYYYSASDVDLTERKFACYHELWLSLNARFMVISNRYGMDSVREKLSAIGVEVTFNHGAECLGELDHENDELIAALAQVLELPSDMLVLRCKEMVAIQQLAEIEACVRRAAQAVERETPSPNIISN